VAPVAGAHPLQSWYMDLIREANAHPADRSLADRLAARLGGPLWSRCLREWKPGTCRSLEHAARRLERLPPPAPAPQDPSEQSPDSPVRLLGSPRWLGWLGVDFGGRALAARLARAILPPPFPDPAQAASTLRIYGVAVCLVRFGLLGFEHCACAEALAASTSAASIAEALHALPDALPDKTPDGIPDDAPDDAPDSPQEPRV
jgi:hypothetical protein